MKIVNSSQKRIIAIVIFAFMLSIIATYPLILNINSSIPGFNQTDEPFAALWNFWWLKYANMNHLNDAYYSTIASPFGISGISGYPIWNFINKWLSLFTNNIFAYNMEVLFSFFASLILMYFLAFYLTKNTVAGIIAAIIYTLSPYHFARTWQHLGLAQIQWMPLYLLSLLAFRNNPGLLGSLWVALVLFLVMSFDFYYAFFMFIVTALFILFIILYKWKSKIKSSSQWSYDGRILKMMLIAVILIIFITLPYTLPILRDRLSYSGKGSGVYNPFLRPFEDLFAQSAKPLSYLLPAAVHPIFGGITEQFVGTDAYGASFTEHTLFLGWVPLILTFIAFRRWRKNKKIQCLTHHQPQSNNEDFYLGFFIFLGVCAWLFSQPPWWNLFGLKLYMPSFFMYKVAPMFRAYCRFGIIVMLAVAVLSNFGIKFFLEKLNNKRRMIAVVGVSVLILFEFWNYPPYKVVDLSKTPAAYVWLKNQPGDWAIAEYPLDTNGANVMYMFYQTRHEKKIINGTVPGTYPNKVAKTLTKLSDFATARALKWMGVKYALVHKDDYLKTELIDEIEELSKISRNPGLRLIKSFASARPFDKTVISTGEISGIDVYEVIASPVKPEIKEE